MSNPPPGRTALHEAASQGNCDQVTKLLLEQKEDLNARDNNGSTPLHEAACRNNSPMIRLLLENGADPNCKTNVRNGVYYTAFHRVLLFGCEESANLFLNHGVDVNLKNYYNNTALHVAVEKFGNAFVEKLLNMGARINAVTDNGETVLHRLLRCYLPDETVLPKMRLLIRYGVDINAIDKMKRTSLYNAIVSNQRFEVVRYLMNLGVKNSEGSKGIPIESAILYGDMGIVEYLSDNLLRVSQKNEESKSLLHSIIENFRNKHQRLQLVRVLIKHGADVNYARISDRMAPLQLAIQDYDIDLFKCLLRHGASVDENYVDQEPILCTAVQSDCCSAASILINSGLSTNKRNFDGNDLLTTAILNDSKKMMTLLLDNGTVISTKNYTTTVLRDSPSILKLLIKRSVTSSSHSSLLNKSLFNAIKANRPQMVTILLQNGADVNFRYDSLELPLEAAIGKVRFSEDHEHRDKEIMFLITRYIQLFSFLDMWIDEENIKLIESRDDTLKRYLACYTELEAMRRTEVCSDSRTTYLDIMTKSQRLLAKCFNHKSVEDRFKLGNYKFMFPLYADDLSNKYAVGVERLNTTHTFCQKFHSLLRKRIREKIPMELIYQISDYLNNEQLETCIYVFKTSE